MFRRGLFVAILSCAPCLGGTVWDNLDTTTLPLDVETIRSQKEGDVTVQVLRYTSEVWDGQPIRVFAMYGKPEGAGKFPAILHIHGGGQTASPRDVAELVRRGYACFSFDWTGKTKDRTEYTDWPKDIGGHYDVKPSPKNNKLYHAALAARRGITFLTQRPEVDANRIASYGISWGGYLMWLVNAADTRLKAAVAVYGCGGLLREGYQYGPPFKKDTPAADIEEWQQNFEPQRLGPAQQAPILWLNGSNDFFGWPPAAAKLLRSCKAETRQSLLANVNHGVGLRAAESAYRWFAHYLKGEPQLPASPTAEISIGADGVPRAVVKTDQGPGIESAWVEYSIGPNKPPGRCWRTAAIQTGDGAQFAVLPVADPAQELQVVVQAAYKGGFKLSSVPASVVPATLGPAKGTLKPTNVVCDFSDGIGGWGPGVSSTQLYGQRSDIELDPAGEDGKPCLKVIPLAEPFTNFSLTFWRTGDPQWKREDAAALSFRIKGVEKAIALTAHVLPQQAGQKNYTTLVPLKPEKGWRSIVVKPEQFKEQTPPNVKVKEEQRNPLASWKDVQCITIGGPCAQDEPPRFGRVEWVMNGE